MFRYIGFSLAWMCFLLTLSGFGVTVTLWPAVPFDLETNAQFSTQQPRLECDLVFGGGTSGNEYLRVLNGALWAVPTTNNFAVPFKLLRQANYSAPIHSFSGHPDIFHTGRQAVPPPGTVYLLRTAEGNLAKIRIVTYQTLDPDPLVARGLKIEYDLYLLTADKDSYWVRVGTGGINSHQAQNAWCPYDSFLVALDLDGPRNISASDSPVVGQAMCRVGAGQLPLKWVGVETAGINSHQPGKAWCPPGNFLVALDLDARGNLSAHDSPVVGQAMCASSNVNPGAWESCSWEPVEKAGINSHQPGKAWCPSGSFLVALDLDAPRDLSEYDSPVVGQAMCCRR